MGILTEAYNRHPTHEECVDAFKRYNQYLESIKQALPPGASTFALAAWHYDMSDSRCPHDAWVEHLNIAEHSSGQRRQKRSVSLYLKLLGANHDGMIEIRYLNVLDYTLAGGGTIDENSTDGHGDWYVDDIQLLENGRVVHEVLFQRGYRWSIECDDIIYQWLPLRQRSKKTG